MSKTRESLEELLKLAQFSGNIERETVDVIMKSIDQIVKEETEAAQEAKSQENSEINITDLAREASIRK